jgi:predicted esterase YcpF (UPF0227 family)
MPKILYLHGLDGSLSQEKKEVLERYFAIVAPELDYRNTPDMFDKLSNLFYTEQFDAVIGNSMGGCFAYYLSLFHSVPALCFNPALGCRRPVEVRLPELKANSHPLVFVLGGQDTVVPAVENFTWIRKNPNPNFTLKWYNEMSHHVGIDTFATEVEAFSRFCF